MFVGTSAHAHPRPLAPVDPWAHRRGEPRVFAMFWVMYVLLAVVGSIEWVTRTSVLVPEAYGPAARIMLVVVAAGAVVLWPMTRLSQVAPERPIVSTFVDAMLVAGPVWLVTWPLVLAPRWPVDVVGALAVSTLAWIMLAGGVLVNAQVSRRARRPGSLGGALWMLVILALCLAGLIVREPLESGYAGADVRTPGWTKMLSPFSSILALSGHGLSGPGSRVEASQWRALGVVGLGAGALWLVALLRSIGRPRGGVSRAVAFVR